MRCASDYYYSSSHSFRNSYLKKSFKLKDLAVVLLLCRNILGNFNVLTVSFVPALLSSYVAILLERPSRRGLLSLYVTNVVSRPTATIHVN
uniref:Transmembrane protein 135 N-terminal domain-containing protein n=1 Tax=Timema monikensis TaxID=170555 RepID=A0A7R9EC85_9NEOP|nr:unnamed protein product [Timema monikensis]